MYLFYTFFMAKRQKSCIYENAICNLCFWLPLCRYKKWRGKNTEIWVTIMVKTLKPRTKTPFTGEWIKADYLSNLTGHRLLNSDFLCGFSLFALPSHTHIYAGFPNTNKPTSERQPTTTQQSWQSQQNNNNINKCYQLPL